MRITTGRDGAASTRLRRVLALLVLGLALTGCAGQPGAAAVVDGEAITEATLADTVADLRVFSPAQPADALQALIVAPIWLEVSRRAGLGVSEQEAETFLDDAATRAGVDPAGLTYGPGIVQIAQVSVAQEKAASTGQVEAVAAAVSERVRAAEIEVSPRYGAWDGAAGLVPLDNAWLITPAPRVARTEP